MGLFDMLGLKKKKVQSDCSHKKNKISPEQVVMNNLYLAQQSLTFAKIPEEGKRAYVVSETHYAQVTVNSSFSFGSIDHVKKLEKNLEQFIETKLLEEGTIGFVPATRSVYNYLEGNYDLVAEGATLMDERYSARVFGKN